MKCQRASKNLTAFLDGELPEAFREKIREHVESCPDCQRERAALERVRQSLDLMEAPTLSEGVSPDAILEREARPGQAFREERNGLRAGRWFPNIRVWQPAAALAVVLVAIGVWQALPRFKAFPPPSDQEIFMVERMDLFENLDLIRNLSRLEGAKPVSIGAGGRS